MLIPINEFHSCHCEFILIFLIIITLICCPPPPHIILNAIVLVDQGDNNENEHNWRFCFWLQRKSDVLSPGIVAVY